MLDDMGHCLLWKYQWYCQYDKNSAANLGFSGLVVVACDSDTALPGSYSAIVANLERARTSSHGAKCFTENTYV
jgi:hypothetical protein